MNGLLSLGRVWFVQWIFEGGAIEMRARLRQRQKCVMRVPSRGPAARDLTF